MSEVVDNRARHRFELSENGALAYADYELKGSVLAVPHVVADPALRGTGAAGRLMEGVLAAIRARGLKIDPVCPYAEAYLRRHPEHADLRA
jgi:uncharacterized protein